MVRKILVIICRPQALEKDNLAVYQSVCLFVCQLVCLFVWLCICYSISLCDFLFVCLPVCISVCRFHLIMLNFSLHFTSFSCVYILCTFFCPSFCPFAVVFNVKKDWFWSFDRNKRWSVIANIVLGYFNSSSNQ